MADEELKRDEEDHESKEDKAEGLREVADAEEKETEVADARAEEAEKDAGK